LHALRPQTAQNDSMKDFKQEISKISSEFKSLMSKFDLPKMQDKLRKLKEESLAPDLWDDQDKARSVMQEYGDLEKELGEIESLKSNIKALEELAKEGEIDASIKTDIDSINKKLSSLKLKSFLSDTYDKKNAIVSIHAGQGGTEAMDWASMLYRMYLRYCEKRGWKTEVLDISEGEEAGIKSITFKVEGPFAYGYLKGEAGTHRLVRQSPFNADKLRQTSFALVGVLPELEEIDLPDIKIKDDDLEWQFFRASTQGGQNVQKVSTAVRVKHIPTNIVTTAQTERFQEQNRKIALNLLRAKLWALAQEKREKKVKEIKGEYTPASWGTQIRSYVLHPYKMVKDLRTNVETSDTQGVLDGDIDIFIEAELDHSQT
jgi:peptide chain release factor 2